MMKRNAKLLKIATFLLAVAPLVIEGRLKGFFGLFTGEPQLPAKLDAYSKS